MALEKLLGQDRATKILTGHLDQAHYHHAYLFHGPKGVGKRTGARDFAHSIFCEEVSPGYCGKCVSCKQFLGGNHPDYSEIEAEDRTIGIEVIRELRRSITLKPFKSAYRIFVIRQAEKLTREAANSFLKSLEEPPEYVIFILTSDNRKLLLPTIISRSFPVAFNHLGKNIIEAFLEEKIEDPQKRKVIAEISGGSIGFACRLGEDDKFLEQREELISRWSKMEKESFLGLFDLVEWLEKEWEGDYPQFFQLLQYWIRDLFYYQNGQEKAILNSDCFDLLSAESPRWKTEKLEKALTLIDELQRGFDRKINRRLALEATLLKINAWRQ